MKSILKDDVISLRALDPSDLESMLRWENDTTLWDVGNTIAPFSKEQIWNYLQNYDGDIYSNRQLRLIIEFNDDNTAIGTVDFYDFDPFNSRAAIGLLIDREYQKRGYGTKALNLTIEYALNYLGLHQCIAIVPEANVASFKLFTNAGFKIIGVMRDWLKNGHKFDSAYMLQKIVEL